MWCGCCIFSLASFDNYPFTPKNYRFDLLNRRIGDFGLARGGWDLLRGAFDDEFYFLYGPGFGLADGEFEVAELEVLAGAG